MTDSDWTIVVVDAIDKKWPPVKQLVQAGVPLSVAARYQPVRREMSPKGLARKMRENRN